MIRKRCKVPAILVLSILGSFARSQDVVVLKAHDLRAMQLAHGLAHQNVKLTLPLQVSCSGPAGETYEREAFGEDLDTPKNLEGPEWIELLTRRLGRGVMAEGAVTVRHESGVLWVRARESTHTEVSAFLRGIERQLLRSVEVRVHQLPASATTEAGGSILPRVAVRKLLGRAPPLATSSASVQLGQSARIVSARRQALLRDYDVEVAQESKISDPLISAPLEGLEVNVQPWAAPEGYFLRVSGRFSILDGPPRTFNSGVLHVGDLQLPKGFSTMAAASALVDDGGGLLLGHNGVPGTLWLIEIQTASSSTPPVDDEGSEFVPVAALTIPAISVAAPRIVGPNASGMGAGIKGDDPLERTAALFDEDRLRERFLLDHGSPADEGVAPYLKLIGENLYIQGSAAFKDAVRSELRRSTGDLCRSAGIELRIGRMDGAKLVDLVARRTDPAEIASRLETVALGAGRSGDSIVLVGGKEVIYLKDQDVEIAQGAVISDPVVDAYFHGFSLEAMISPLRDGRLALQAKLAYQTEVADLGKFSTGLPEVGSIEAPSLSHVSHRTNIVLENGRWTLLLAAPLSGTEEGVVAVIKAVW